ncbi:DUF1905 domain-containing protein [Altererythrobacter lutimaris]|uniref:DUF1905 domain-containing protein n=1 Tax=Altererythrobacter lutimaris TaxID=2743979 RepID=A0A850HE84_9SPHN|nr:DUF1905 domain-containing protein [Altererythrobacter lutimaris]NVE95990.1 DUF1905 domain-containing protein [Altererythrobacter lutimaris]
MTETVTTTCPLIRWRGDRGTYHLVTIDGEVAEAITAHATLRRLEFGRQRGFGSVKVIARIGDTEWKTSVFPMNMDDMSRRSKNWTLLISKKVMRSEGLEVGDPVPICLELL